MSKEIQHTSDKDITFNSNGEGYISQYKLADLLGMAKKTFNDNFHKFMAHNPPALKVNNINQIHEDSLFDVVEFMAKRPTAKQETKNFFFKLKKLGARSLLIGVAQHPPAVVNQTLSVYENNKQILKMLLASNEQAEQLALAQANSDKRIDTIDRKIAAVLQGNQCPKGYLPKYKIAIHFNVPLNKSLLDLLDTVRSYRYPYASGTGGIRYATAYCVEDVRVLLET